MHTAIQNIAGISDKSLRYAHERALLFRNTLTVKVLGLIAK